MPPDAKLPWEPYRLWGPERMLNKLEQGLWRVSLTFCSSAWGMPSLMELKQYWTRPAERSAVTSPRAMHHDCGG